jgi:hypothetical protein
VVTKVAKDTSISKGVAAKIGDALIAVLLGNAIYFLLMPHLPQAMRHSLFREDWGLLIDFCICAGIFGFVQWMHSRAGR